MTLGLKFVFDSATAHHWGTIIISKNLENVRKNWL